MSSSSLRSIKIIQRVKMYLRNIYDTYTRNKNKKTRMVASRTRKRQAHCKRAQNISQRKEERENKKRFHDHHDRLETLKDEVHSGHGSQSKNIQRKIQEKSRGLCFTVDLPRRTRCIPGTGPSPCKCPTIRNLRRGRAPSGSMGEESPGFGRS